MSPIATSIPNAPAAPHQALYRRWRAQTFGEIVGQTAVVETLRNAVRLDRVAHGLLFVGPRGTGKTSMARIVAKAINCAHVVDGEPCDSCASCVSIREGRALDVVEMDAASNNRVDDMRELLPRVYTAPADVRRKVFIVDEVQRIKEGWDVLLKTLEEPPDNVVFIFCTTNPSGIRPAVVSRLQRYTFRPLTIAEIEGKLAKILEGEGRAAEPGAVRLVAGLAAGGMRDAESMLDQLLSGSSDPLTAGGVRELLGLADARAVDAFVDALAGGDPLAGVTVLDELEANGADLVAFGDQLVARLRQALVARLSGAPGPTPGTRDAAPALLAAAARRLTGLDANRAGAGGYRFQLEVAVLQVAAADGLTTEVDAARAATGDRPLPPRPAEPEASPRLVGRAPAAPREVAETNGSAPAEAPPTPAAPGPADAPAPPPSLSTAGASVEARANAGPPSPTPVASPPGSGGDVLDRLRRGWPELVAHVGRNPANRPLISACRPVDVENGVVVLGFPEDQAFLRDIAERKRAALEEAVRAVLGEPYAVRCVATNVDSLQPLTPDEGVDLVEHARRIFEGDVADVAEIR